MRKFCIAVTEYTYVDIPNEELEGLSDDEACDLAEEKFNDGEYSDVGDPWIEVFEC